MTYHIACKYCKKLVLVLIITRNIILTKMLGTKIFLLLGLSVLGNSIPQPELRIHIHLHQDDFQPGPARGPTPNIGHVGNRIVTFPGGADYPSRQFFKAGSDYGDYGNKGEYSIGRFG